MGVEVVGFVLKEDCLRICIFGYLECFRKEREVVLDCFDKLQLKTGNVSLDQVGWLGCVRWISTCILLVFSFISPNQQINPHTNTQTTTHASATNI